MTAGIATGISSEKTCNVCYQTLSTARFNRDAASSDGMDGRCVECKADQRRLLNYDLTARAYKRLLLLQNYECAVCRSTPDELEVGLSVEHDHATGEVRSLSCRDCNLLLAYCHESVTILKQAIHYLEVHQHDIT